MTPVWRVHGGIGLMVYRVAERGGDFWFGCVELVLCWSSWFFEVFVCRFGVFFVTHSSSSRSSAYAHASHFSNQRRFESCLRAVGLLGGFLYTLVYGRDVVLPGVVLVRATLALLRRSVP